MTVYKSALLPYSAEQMYQLVNDVQSYPEFLPWCHSSQVFDESDTSLIAEVCLKVGKVKQTFSTRNSMVPSKSIKVGLLQGPFKKLTGGWQFTNVADGGCRVTLNMSFEFKNVLLKLALEKTFNSLIKSLMDSFSERAKQIYG